MQNRPRVTIVVEPRFKGGTSSAVAREIITLASVCDLEVVFFKSDMFSDDHIENPKIVAALEMVGITAKSNPVQISSETIVLHNPSFLKFNKEFTPRLNCARAIVVAHENFCNPMGNEAFDVAHSLQLISSRLITAERLIAPVSQYNRRTVETWLEQHPVEASTWHLAAIDWFNICDFPTIAPTTTPQDRRGRVSRPGVEKFPDTEMMHRHFPAHAERCAILGGDGFLLPSSVAPSHWCLVPFGGADVGQFLSTIDFFIYFTSPNWRESFGRVIAEAIAAGKVVITDPGTAEIFGTAVVASNGHDVDEIIANFVSNPARYVSFVTSAQQRLSAFSAEAFRVSVCGFLKQPVKYGALV